MKILCVSDMIDPLIYSQNAKRTFPGIDLILCAGDLPMDYIDFIVSTFNKPTCFVFGNHNLGEWKYYHRDASARAASPREITRAASVPSGHGALYAGFRAIRSRTLFARDKKTGRARPLLIAGASGSLNYNNGPAQYTEFQMKLKLLSLVPALLFNKLRWGTYLDIFLAHAAPRGVHDQDDPCHRGFECFNWLIKKFHPAYFVHGHIHLYDMRAPRVTKVGATSVVNAYAHAILEY